jgi:hypothetical protein
MLKEMTVAEFVASNAIGMSVAWTDRNPNMAGSDRMDHWKCVLRFGKRRMTVVFSMGAGHGGAEPKVCEVLDCLASDANGADEMFESWCGRYGYDTDSRSAERTYKAVRQSAAKLRRFLGADGLSALLNCERL